MALSLSDEVLAMLVCPVTKQALRRAADNERADWTSEQSFEEVLLTTDGTRAYPVRDGFPVLVAAESLTKRP